MLKAARKTAKATHAVHQQNMVWTEIKAENFVVTDDDLNVGENMYKGIDLESAVPVGEFPLDFTTKSIPPEFAREYTCGREATAKMEYSFDVWSLGMLLYKLAVGEHYFSGLDDFCITRSLSTMEEVNLDNVHLQNNPQLKDLVGQCLQVNPDDRPSMDEVLAHPYFN